MAPMEVLIRPFRPDDWDGIFFLDRACFEAPYRLEYPRLRALVEDPGVVVLVIEAHAPGEDGEEETALVGSLLLKHEAGAERLVLISVMIDPGFRGVGLGRRLVGWAEKIARSRSLRELLAPLEAENAAGSAFLTALGFVRESGAPPFFEDTAGGNLWRRPVTDNPIAAAPQPAAGTASADAESLGAGALEPAAAPAGEPDAPSVVSPPATAPDSQPPETEPLSSEASAVPSEPASKDLP